MVSRRAEQLRLGVQQRIVATAKDSVLRTGMTGLESQEEDVPSRNLGFKTVGWLGKIRSHRRDESWSASLCQTFLPTSVGAYIPLLVEEPFSVYGSRKFQIDTLGDHLCTCTSHSGAKKSHDLSADQIADLFRTQSENETGDEEPGSVMWGHRVGDLPRGGSGAFGTGPAHCS